LAQRNRKRQRQRRKPRPGQSAQGKSSSQPPAGQPDPEGREQGSVGGWRVEPRMSRTERRNAEIRAGLTPIPRGERPRAIIVSTVIAGLIGVGQLVAFFAGLKIHGKAPAGGGTIAFCVLMIACAIGMWRLWYGAVLGFMALLAIVAVLFSLLLIEASNVLGTLVAIVVVAGSGYLFFKLVRVLSRIQMPRYPGS
jgi:hypothetical protein